jgi:hypothetical protein
MIEGEERPARDRRHAPAGVYAYLPDPANTILSSSAYATPGPPRFPSPPARPAASS